MQDRELMLAETKKRSDEYKAQKAGIVQSQSSASSATITPTKATFSF